MKPSIFALTGAALLATGCAKIEDAPDETSLADAIEAPEGLAPGSNEMLRADLSAAPGLEVLVSDVIIPPGAEVPRHYHPGEEFVYVIEGSATHVEEGKPDRELGTGDAIVISPKAVHAPRGGPQGARAIVFRVHIEDMPERVPVTEAGT